ncbi:MAG: NADH-quinone oxidoreductase subunit M [Gemmatimonadales bacterium]|nr:NADH-quinone oxidoreductase subunit M [Gemmatimonadales bacterium]
MATFLAAIGYGSWILHFLLWLPLLGVPLVMFAPKAWARWVALVIAITEFVVSLGLWWAFDPANGGLQFRTTADWLPQLGVRYEIGIDGISLFMVLLSTALMPLLVAGSWRVVEMKQRGFYALLLALKTGMLGVFMALDLFLFYCFWELLLIPMYFLIGIWGSENRLYAATKFVIYTFAGSLLMLVAIVSMVWTVGEATGTWSFSYDHLLRHRDILAGNGPWLFTAFALAFAVKVPLFPFHTWLPDAHGEAPTAGSVDLAVILLKMGTYGFLRFAVPLFPSFALSTPVSALFVTLAVTGILYAALVASAQDDLKKIVAYSSVSHLGFVILGTWAGTVESVQGGMMVMIAHGIATGGLFFLVGMLYERTHTRQLAEYGGLAKVAPMLACAFAITAFASIGVPGLSGFVGEFLVLIGTFGRYPVASTIAALVVIASALYLLRPVQGIFFNPLAKDAYRDMPDLSARELVVLVPLLAVMLWVGLYPKPILDRTQAASARYVELVKPYLPGERMSVEGRLAGPAPAPVAPAAASGGQP